ncbi:hypothetical protein TRVL_04181 [Trypanosoma vivax]|nr:hypothetical protein TRVL_04181 [Trypanosoma vivax]
MECTLQSKKIREELLMLSGSTGVIKTIGTLSVLLEPVFYADTNTSEGCVEMMAQLMVSHKLHVLLIKAHTVVLHVLSTRGEGPPDAKLITLDAGQMTLLHRIMSQTQSELLFTEELSLNEVMEATVKTFEFTVAHPVSGSVELSESARMVIDVLVRKWYTTLSASPSCCNEADKGNGEAAFQRALHPEHPSSSRTDSTLPQEAMAMRLKSLVCCLESLLHLRSATGFPTVETIDFGIMLFILLPLQYVMAQHVEDTHRLFGCIRTIATASRTQAAPDKPRPVVRGVAGLLSSVLSSSYGKIQRLVSDSSTEPQTLITCREAVECVTSFFVCTTEQSAADASGDVLFELISSNGVEEDLVKFVVHSCTESIHTLKPFQLHRVLKLLRTLYGRGTWVSEAVATLVNRALSLEPGAATEIKGCLLVFVSIYVSKEPYDVASTLLQNVLQLTLTNLNSIKDWGDAAVYVYMKSVEQLTKTALTHAPLLGLLASVEWHQYILVLLLRTLDMGCIEVAIVLCRIYLSMVVKEANFIDVLFIKLTTCVEEKPWPSQASTLLRVAICILQEEKGAWAAIRANGVHTCLRLLGATECSTFPERDRHLIGTVLALMLSHLRWSDVGTAVLHFAQCTPAAWVVQLLADICSGFFTATENLLVATDLSIATASAAIKADRMRCEKVGQFFLPKFCRFEHLFPFAIFVSWMTELTDETASFTEDLKTLVYTMARRHGKTINDETFTAIVLGNRLYGLYPYVADVTRDDVLAVLCPPRETVGIKELGSLQSIWESLLKVKCQGSRNGFHDYIELHEDAGLQGVVARESYVCSPHSDFTVAQWVFWERCEAGETDQFLQVWELLWSAENETSTVSLVVDVLEKKTYLSFAMADKLRQKIALPFIAPSRWQHVVLTCSFGGMFSGQVKVFYDGVCVREDTVPSTSTTLSSYSRGATIVTRILSEGTYTLTCTVGAQQGTRVRGLVSRFISFHVFTETMSEEMVVSLFCTPLYSVMGCHDEKVFALESPLLEQEMLRCIASTASCPKVHQLVDARLVRLAPVPLSSVLVSVHVQGAQLVEAPHLRSFCNKMWTIHSLGCGVVKSGFVLYGMHSEPTVATVGSPLSALVSHGAANEWLHWLEIISEAFKASRISAGGVEGKGMDSTGDGITLLQDAAATALRVISHFCIEQLVGELSMTAFISCVTAHILESPSVFLGTESGVNDVLSLCITKMPACEHLMLYHTTPMEHIFFNWRVTTRLPEACQRSIMTALCGLLQSNNPFRIVNAVRLRRCDFFNGFVCGLVREYTGSSLLGSAVQVISLYVECLGNDPGALGDILTLCAMTVPVERDLEVVRGQLVSKMPVEALNYVAVTVCNLLLKVLCDACARCCSEEAKSCVEVLACTMPRCWFVVMTHRWSHPVSVIMAMHLFTLCYTRSAKFRCRFEDTVLMLCENLKYHSHQSDLLTLLLHCAAGCDWEPQVRSNELAIQYDGVESSHLVSPMLMLIMELLGRNAILLSNGPLKVNFKVTICASYFASALVLNEGKENIPGSPKQRWKCVMNVVLFSTRLRKWKKTTSIDRSTILSTEGVEIDLPELERKSIQTLKWIADNYCRNVAVSKSMYSSQETCNPLDMVSLFLLYALQAGGAVKTSEIWHLSVLEVLRGSTDGISSHHERDEFVDDYKHEDYYESAPDEEDAAESLEPSICVDEQYFNSNNNVTTHQVVHEAYNLCATLLTAHARRFVENSKKISYLTEMGTVHVFPKLVLALHRAMALYPCSLEGDTARIYGDALCDFWLQALTTSLRDATAGRASNVLISNALETARYIMSRLKSGTSTSHHALAKLLHCLLDISPSGTNGTLLFELVTEWLINVMALASCDKDYSKAVAAVELLHADHNRFLTVCIPSAELLRLETLQLISLSHIVLSQTAGLASSVVEKLVYLWQVLVFSNSNSNAFKKVWIGSGRNGSGCSLGVLANSVLNKEELTSLLSEKHDEMEAWLVAHEGERDITGRVLNGAKYRRWLRQAKLKRNHKRLEFVQMCQKTHAVAHSEWLQFVSSSTIIDSALLRQSSLSIAVSRHQPLTCMKAHHAVDENRTTPYLHHSGAVGRPCGSPGAAQRYALGMFLRYAPLACAPLSLSEQRVVVQGHSLQPQVLAVLHRIVGPPVLNQITYAGNAYYLPDNECHMCVLIITNREVVIIEDCQLTHSGNMVMSPHQQPCLPLRKSTERDTSILESVRRFLPWQSSDKTTSTPSADLYSQHFWEICQKLRSCNSYAVVWRFFTWNIQTVHERFFQYMHVALELCLENGDKHFLVLLDSEQCFSEKAREKASAVISRVAPCSSIETYRVKSSQLSTLTEQWAKRAISNRHYLLQLNDIAGRTVADMGQYPVMPWVISDFRSVSIDLKDPSVYRNLAKPIGALNPAKEANLRERFENWLDKSQPPFHYGTHYSNSAVVMYYLIRLEPFTQRSIRYQGGRLDIADRLFHSVAAAWDSCMGSGDVKELIPEFFQLPNIFLNMSNINLGVRHDGVQLGDVELPAWCGGSVEKFVYMHTSALEGDIVSENLHEWINLVFGYKQQGEEAVQALNVFSHLSYQHGVESAFRKATSEEECKAIVAAAANFGQTPKQIFLRPHSRRQTAENSYTMQDYFIENMNDCKIRRRDVYYPWKSEAECAPISTLATVDSCIAASTQYSLFLPTNPLQICHYDKKTREVYIHQHGKPSIISVLPNVHRHGHGEVTHMCTSEKGGIIYLATRKGRVIVCKREQRANAFHVAEILRVGRVGQNDEVDYMKSWNSGHVMISSGAGHTLSLWHVAHSGVLLCFTINFRDIMNEEPCSVRGITHDEYQQFYLVATSTHLVLLSRRGTTLMITRIKDTVESPQNTAGKATAKINTVDMNSPISAVEYVNMSSYSKVNVALVGHENGLISLWGIAATNIHTSTDLGFTATLLSTHKLPSNAPITAIQSDNLNIAIGNKNGQVWCLALPCPQNGDINEP